MCGICGFVERGGRSGEESLRATVGAMADTLAHRGPDDRGTWVQAASGVALGHRRLSILDLSSAGAQPMVSSCGRFVLVYNGEIYDARALRAELAEAGRRFRGHSDTEVLLEAIAAWGVEAALERVQGMFAFGLWDTRERTLTLARDRVGKKPLYYGWQGDLFFFASELKALEAHPSFHPAVDRGALGLLVRYSYVPAPYSIYEGVRKLAPGAYLTLRPEKGPEDESLHPYWSPRTVAEQGAADPFAGSAEQAEEALDELLRDAVGARMIADVPLGALLSGGIDSSVVVAQMQELSSRPVQTFSIGFEESEYDEAHHARRVAQHLGTDHCELFVRPEDALAVIPRLPRLYDEPFADTSQIPTFLVSRLARQHVTVALSGDGGDELFAGYNRYERCLSRWRWLARVPIAWRGAVANACESLADRSDAREGGEASSALRRLGGRLDGLVAPLRAASVEDLFASMNSRHRDVGSLVPGAGDPPTWLSDRSRWPSVPDPLQWMMTVDLAGNLAEDILVKVDRASMGVSLEVRCPLLDRRVVEFAWRLPIALRARRGERKWLLKQVLARRVPRALTERPKMGFGVPLAAWLRGPLRDWAESLLAEDRLRREGHLDPKAVRRVWHQHLSGWRDRRFLLWNLLMFQAWIDDRAGGSPAGQAGAR